MPSARSYPEVSVDKQHIDILSARFVLQPQRFDVVVASNLFGDILSDLGPPDHRHDRPCAIGQPQSGAQVPVAVRAGARLGAGHLRQNIANPIAMIWSGALMLDFLGFRDAHDAIVSAIETVLAQGPRTRDLGGTASTTEIGEAIASLV